MPVAKCALCHQVKELQNSHYIPKELYSTARESSLANPNPVIVSNGIMLQTSDQLSDYLLCADCEGLLDRNGEKWVLARIPKGYQEPFALRDALKTEQPIYIGDGINIYAGSKIPSFDMEKIAYFGMSIFWRGAVHEWKDRVGTPTPPVELCGYEDPIRQFLLGGAFPKDVVLEVFICAYNEVWPSMWLPTAAPLPERQRYWFYISGLIFILNFGYQMPEATRRRCAYSYPQRVIIIDALVSETVRKKMSAEMKGSKPVRAFDKFLKGPDPRKKS